MNTRAMCWGLSIAVAVSSGALRLGAQVKRPSTSGPNATPTKQVLIDRFVQACEVKDPAWQQLWQSESVKLPYRGHIVSRVIAADAEAGSVVRVFFDGVLEPNDDSGIAELWYPSPQDLRENRGANGAANYSDRTFRTGRGGEKATMKLIRLIYSDRATGKLSEGKERTNFPEAPPSAGWLIECEMRR